MNNIEHQARYIHDPIKENYLDMKFGINIMKNNHTSEKYFVIIATIILAVIIILSLFYVIIIPFLLGILGLNLP
jgi:hypothetical protein